MSDFGTFLKKHKATDAETERLAVFLMAMRLMSCRKLLAGLWGMQ